MTEPAKQSGNDPIGDLQRWLVRSGARSVSRQLSGQIRTALGGGGGKQSSSDVWETATSDFDESPECAWCPICRARRRLRESGPGLSSGVAAAADAVGVVMQDAMSAFEAAVSAAGRQTRPRDTTVPPADEVWEEATDEPTAPPRPAQPHRPAAQPRRPAAQPHRPAANGSTARPTGPRQASAETKQPSAGLKKPAAGPKKPAARSGGSAATDRTPPDKSTAAKPDEPTD